MINFYRKLSIFQKMILAPAISITFFMFYLFYTAYEHDVTQDNLTDVKSTIFPILEIADQNLVYFEKVEDRVEDAIIDQVIEWVVDDDIIEYRQEYLDNLDRLSTEFKDHVDTDFVAEMLKDYNEYYDLVIYVSKLPDTLSEEEREAYNRRLVVYHQKIENDIIDFRARRYIVFKNILDQTSDHLSRILFFGVILGIVTLILTVIASTALSIPTRKSIRELLDSIKHIAHNEPDFKKRIKKTSDDELGELVESFNSFTGKLEEDYNELDSAHKMLKKTQKKLVESEKMASLGNLVAGVAHEINTPVGTAYTTATVLENMFQNIDRENEKQMDKVINKTQKGFPLILTNLKRASELIKSFKQVSVDQHTDSLREINLYDYITDLTKSLKYEYEKNNHIMTIHNTSEDLITTYPGAIGQIITNLVMNSVKHGFKGESEKEISIDLEHTENSVKILYKDNGKGMEEEVKTKVFDPFFTTDKQDGTGLGMNITYNLVTQKLQGSIALESSPNNGVEVKIELPKTIEE